MTKISFVTILSFLVHSSLVRAQGIRRVKASKSGDGRGNMDQNEIGFGTPSALINDFKLSGTRKQGKSDKASKNHKGSKSEKVVSSVFRSVVMDFCDALTNCSSSTTIDSPRALTSDLSCTGTIIIDEGGILDGNGLTISSEQSPTIVVKNGGTLKNIGITGSAAVGVRFDDNNGAMESVKYDGTGTAVEVVDGSERVTVADLASSSAATLVSVTGGSGPVVIDQARYNGNGTGILVDDSEQSVSIQSLHVSGAASAVTVAAADQVSITNLLCYESRECVTASNIMALAMKDSNIMGTSTGHGISFDSLDGDLQLDNLIVRDAALGGLVVANAQNIKIGSSKFLSNGQDGVSIEECVKIVVEDVFAGSNGGNGMDIRCTDVTDDALFQDVALLDNGGTDLSANITLSSTSDDVYFNNVVACGDGSISLKILENQLFVSNLVTDDCNLNGGDNCDQFSNSIVSCEEFCNDSTTLIDSVISSSFSSSD